MARKKKETLESNASNIEKVLLGNEWYEFEGDGEADLDIETLSFKRESRKTVKNSEVISDIGINDGAEEHIETREELQFRDWNVLNEYSSRGSILESTICAVEPNPLTKTLLVITKYLSFDRIVIPESEFFYENSFKGDYVDQTEEEQFRRRYQMLRNMVGGKISFIIAGLERKKTASGDYEHFIVASRLMAARKKREYFFFGPEGPIVEVGSVVEGRIMSMNKIWAKVDVYGIETPIHISQLSMNSWIKDVRKSFVVGQKIKARVHRLDIDKETKQVKIYLSRRELGGNILIENAKKMKIGTVAIGEIISFNKEKDVATAVLHGDVLASIPKTRMFDDEILLPGDQVCAVIVDTRYDKGYVICNATRIRNKYNTF